MPIKIQNTPINEPQPRSGGIAWHIENTLVRFVKRIINDVKDIVIEIMAGSLYRFLELIEPAIKSSTSGTLGDLSKLPGLPGNVRQDIINTLQSEHQASGALRIVYSLAGIIGYMTGPMSVTSRLSSYTADSLLLSGRPNPLELWQMVKRGAVPAGEAHKALSELGLADIYKTGYQELTRNLLEPSDLTTALFRGIISDDYFRETLRKKGYNVNDTETIMQMLPIIPGVGDLIRMAVREAFDDKTAALFGYDDNYPSEFGYWTEKQGLSEDWAKRFWRAHWELPGIRDAFEMLHRDIINEAEMERLFIAKDIPSFWRKALLEMSYSPYTRVDVRRMYQMGTIDESEVLRTYKDLGYDEEKANKLTDWTISEYAQNELELTKSDIFSSLVDGVITEAEAREYFEAIGRKGVEVDLLLARASLKKQEEFEKELIQNVRVSFVAGLIDENDVYSQLSAIDPPSGFIEDRLKIWRLQKQRGVKKPTLANLRDFWLNGVIDTERLKSEMSLLGYANVYIDLYMEYWSLSAQE